MWRPDQREPREPRGQNTVSANIIGNCVLTPRLCGPLASFLVFRLTEERTFAVDPANAARTLLFGLEAFDWNDGLLHLFGIERTLLPACVPTRFDYGHLAAGRRIPLQLVTGDQSAALFAYGAPHANSGYLNIGTGAFVQRTSGHYPGYQARLLTGVVLRDAEETVYVLEGTVNGAGAALAWAEAELGLDDLEEQLPEWLTRNGELPLFLNGIGGLGAPFWVANFASRFEGAGEPWQQAVAVAESVVFLIEANLEIFQKLVAPLERLIVSGGLTAFDGLCQRLADLSGLPVYRPVEHEATARGTAWLLAGKPARWSEPELGVWFKPQVHEALRERYRRWRQAMNVVVARGSGQRRVGP